ncbi:MAG: nucleotidyl transferase AbiEii/AbiGii toxin family protein [Candidatus Xenobiia bacterium LiM19]
MNDHYERLYSLQDKVLNIISSLKTEFYLTGGTALSRGYLHHRYSDDLDFFIHGEKAFIDNVQALVIQLRTLPYLVEVERMHEAFSRIIVKEDDESKDNLILKVDFVNEKHLPHFGSLLPLPFFPLVDNMRNILSNKIGALTRLEAKDVIDIWGICTKLPFAWEEIIEEANQKSPVEELMVVDLLRTFPAALFDTIKWIKPVNPGDFEKARETIIEDLITKNTNSLCSTSRVE